jgi:hypothetical protein
MNFKLPMAYANADGVKRDAIILACISKKYFGPVVAQTGANPLLWTTGLMCPEAYTLHDAAREYVRHASTDVIRASAIKAYAKGQHCGEKEAGNLLVSGW